MATPVVIVSGKTTNKIVLLGGLSTDDKKPDVICASGSGNGYNEISGSSLLTGSSVGTLFITPYANWATINGKPPADDTPTGNRWIGDHFAFESATSRLIWHTPISDDLGACSLSGIGIAPSYLEVMSVGVLSESYWLNDAILATKTPSDDTGWKCYSNNYSGNNQKAYQLTIGGASDNSAGSIVLVSPDGKQTFSKDRVADLLFYFLGGERAHFRFIPADGIHVVVTDWNVRGSSQGVSGNDFVYEFPSAPNKDLTVSCSVSYTYRYVFKSSDESLGTVSGDALDSWVVSGTKFTATATATNEGIFDGWYSGVGEDLAPEECTTLETEDATLPVTSNSISKTYVAKFHSKRTDVSIRSDGDGVFDVYLDNVLQASGVSAYSANDVLSGSTVRIVSSANSGSYLSGLTLNGDAVAFDGDETFDLSDIPSHAFVVLFSEKSAGLSVRVSSSGLDGSSFLGDWRFEDTYSGSSVYTDYDAPFDVLGLFDNTRYSVKANDEEQGVYLFSKWQWLDGSTWVDLEEEDSSHWPALVSGVNGRKVTLFASSGGSIVEVALRSVYARNDALVCVKKVTIAGDHPINGNKASDGKCSYSFNETPSATLDGVDYWAKGTKVYLDVFGDEKWEPKRIDVYFSDSNAEIISFEGSYLEFSLDSDILDLQLTFEAKKVTISVQVHEASALVGEAMFEYVTGLDTLGNPILATSTSSAKVWIDTDVRFLPSVKSQYENDAYFHFWQNAADKWSIDNQISNGATNLTLQSVSTDRSLMATFAVNNIKFSVAGSDTTEAGDVRWFGRALIKHGSIGRDCHYSFEIELPYSGTNSQTSSWTGSLTCGDKPFFLATPNTYDDIRCYFDGWYLVDDDGTEHPLSGWGAEYSDWVVQQPNVHIRAKFSTQELWRVLRLRDEYLSVFHVSGVRSEREQVIVNSDGSTETRVLRDENDFFCDPFSTVMIDVDPAESIKNRRFKFWQRYAFGNLESASDELMDQQYNGNPISLMMTDDIQLRPIWSSGEVLDVRVALAKGSSAGGLYVESSGVLIEGDEVTLVAAPKNGYRFAGWFLDFDGTEFVSESPRYRVTIEQSIVFYGKFVHDANSIWVFGNGDENKQLTWRSRRVNVGTPVSFSCAQVDIEGSYRDVTLSVEHGSSPELPFRSEHYQISDGNSRRLRFVGRPDRLWEFEVVSSAPVNFIAVSTSVSGLTGGE